jgi:hypothetical protein
MAVQAGHKAVPVAVAVEATKAKSACHAGLLLLLMVRVTVTAALAVVSLVAEGLLGGAEVAVPVCAIVVPPVRPETSVTKVGRLEIPVAVSAGLSPVVEVWGQR